MNEGGMLEYYSNAMDKTMPIDNRRNVKKIGMPRFVGEVLNGYRFFSLVSNSSFRILPKLNDKLKGTSLSLPSL